MRARLPLGRERAGTARSRASGSARPGSGHARGRVAVQARLPLGRERAGTVRSGASGSAEMGSRHARGRVAVQSTLPLGRERTGPVRLKASGSAGMGPRYAQRRVAVRNRGLGTFRGEWQRRDGVRVRKRPPGSMTHTAGRHSRHVMHIACLTQHSSTQRSAVTPCTVHMLRCF